MKKLLSFLGAISLIGTSTASAIACTTKTKDNETLVNIKHKLGQYIESPFFASSSRLTNEQLAVELGHNIALGSFKLIVENNALFVQPKIMSDNVLTNENERNNTLAISQQQEPIDHLNVVSGTASISILKNNKVEFNIQIKWATNELLYLASSVNKINNTSDVKHNIPLPLPIPSSLLSGANLTFDILEQLVPLLPLPEDQINKIDLTKIGEPNFIEKFDDVLKALIKNIGNLVDIGSYLKTDISFNETIKGKGTVNDLIHNIAPDLIAFLKWFIAEGKGKIDETTNVVLPLVQYLLSPINPALKEHIKIAFGEEGYFYKNTKTNFDSLMFHLLVGYKDEYEAKESRYVFSKEIAIFEKEITQTIIGTLLSLEPTLLFSSILDVFAVKSSEQGIDAVNTNIIQPSEWKGISSLITSFISGINVFLGPELMNYTGKSILHDLGINNTELYSNDITINSGRVTLQFKDEQSHKWKDFTAIVGENNDLNLTQILNASDFKTSFTDVTFKVIPHTNNKIAKKTKIKTNFDLWFSNKLE